MPHPPFRVAVRVAAAFVLAASLAADAGAWQVRNWIGRSIHTETGAFGGCRLSVVYDDGITLHVLQFANFSLLAGLSRPDWRLDPNGAYARETVIEGRRALRARARLMPHPERLDKIRNWRKTVIGHSSRQEGPIGRWPI